MTKKKIMMLLFASFACLISIATAQTYYYNETRVFHEVGYRYIGVTQDWGYVTLANLHNLYTEVSHYVYKDGRTFNQRDVLEGRVSLIEDDNWTKQRSMSIVNNAFSAAEKARVRGEKFMVVMTINPDTGKVIGVHFEFYKDE